MATSHDWELKAALSPPPLIALTDLRPEYDVQMGRFPDDRAMAVDELLRPVILKTSDQHIGLRNSYVAKFYEMREHVIPKVVTSNGDKFDLQALASREAFLSIEALCLIDQANWLQAKHGISELATEGNHDQKFVLAIEEARQTGLNIFPGIRITHPGKRDTVQLHGHHFDSPTMVVLPMRIAAGIYDDMVSRGEDGAAAGKIITKLLLDGLGYEQAYKHASHELDANLDIGHLHLVKLLKLQYERELSLSNLTTDAKNLAKNSLISSILWLHRTGGLETFITEALLPAFRWAAKEATDGLDATPVGMAQKRPTIFQRVASQLLPVLEKDPSVSLLKDLTLENLRPLNRKKTAKTTPSGATAAEVNVYGCWIDNRSTFGATYADGTTYSIDWMKLREKIKETKNLPEIIPAGNDLVIKHMAAYGGFHPNTIKQMQLIHDLRGVLSDEDTKKHARLPEIKAMPELRLNAGGEVVIMTPSGEPLATAALPKSYEIVRPVELIGILEHIDPRTADDLRKRTTESAGMKELFQPSASGITALGVEVHKGPRQTPDFHFPVRPLALPVPSLTTSPVAN